MPDADDDELERTVAAHASHLDARLRERHADEQSPDLETGARARRRTLVGGPRKNQLLAALATRDFVFEHLESAWLPLGRMLYEPGVQLNYAYFPTTAIVSLRYVVASGAPTEIASVGNEGVVGVPLFMGGDTTPSSASVQIAGHAYRLPRRLLKEAFERQPATMNLLLRYTQALMTQITQNAVCNRHHTVDQQLCRWLLMALDRVPATRMAMTHELLANTLGVRRESITAAAGKLQRAGAISYERGQIAILERSRLEAMACECYNVVKHAFNRLLEPERLPAMKASRP